MSFECSPYLWTNTADAQTITKKKRRTNKHAYDMRCNAILENKLMLVKFDARLSFFTHKGVILTMLDKPYTQFFLYFYFWVCMICKTKAIYKVNTQLHFLVKLERSSTLRSFLNIQNLASSRGFVKISVN